MSTVNHYMGPNTIHPQLASFAVNAFEGYTMEALNGVITSVPEWFTLLDNLNSQISRRQLELAELSDYRPPTRSLKPKGSTESLLRPKDADEIPFGEDENSNAGHLDSFKPTGPSQEPNLPLQLTPAKNTEHVFSSDTPPQLFHHSSSPGPAPLQRRTSGRLNSPNFVSRPTFPTILRKRKTESIASGESQAPKYRTRSMIIVYYDSAVQNAFEELVKLISASRNAMRKGKMAARMADMKRMAELEADTDSDEETSTPEDAQKGLANGNGHEKGPSPSTPVKMDVDVSKDEEGLSKLQFVSTRRMGPSRDSPGAAAIRGMGHGPMTRTGRRIVLPNYRGTSGAVAPKSFSSIFDELDSGLEWCQSMCEHAAHQFLRDGTCAIEIEGIKKRLSEVKEVAEKEAAKNIAEEKKKKEEKQMKLDEAKVEDTTCAKRPEEARGLKLIQMRKTFNAVKSIEADYIEVDDEGYDDKLPTLQWRSAGDRVLLP